MDAKQALTTVNAWVDDACSFVHTFDPEDLGDPNRPCAEGSAEDLDLDEALRTLGRLIDTAAEVVDEAELNYGAWGPPTHAEDDPAVALSVILGRPLVEVDEDE